MRPKLGLFLFLLLGFFSPSSSAQLLYVTFKSPKDAKPHSDALTIYRGADCVIGELKSGITIKDGTINYMQGAQPLNVLWAVDPSKPQSIPYELKNGVRVAAKGARIAAIPGDAIAMIGYVDRYLTIEGLAAEYASRTTEIQGLRAARDAEKKGERAWFAAHGRVLAKLDSCVSWLGSMGFGGAAKKLRADLERERKTVAKEASAIREKNALGSIHAIEVPERLAEVATELLGKKAKYSARESMHARILYPSGQIDDGQADHALELAEQIVEGFRKQCVDPYLDEDFEDYIPDQVFAEIFLLPDDQNAYDGFLSKFYGATPNRDPDAPKSGGTYFGRGRRVYVSFQKVPEQFDLEGSVAHSIGHFLCDLHFNGGSQNDPQEWLREGLAYYLSFEYIGRNSSTCFAFNSKREYEFEKKTDRSDVTVQRGEKGAFNEIALKQGPTLDQLIIKKLYQFTDADLAKSWSFLDWIIKTQGRSGQIFLRRLCYSARSKGVLEKEREETEALFGVEKGKDVYQVLEEKWKAYAKRDQLK